MNLEQLHSAHRTYYCGVDKFRGYIIFALFVAHAWVIEQHEN